MDRLLLLSGRVIGTAGLALCAIAVAARLAGSYYLAGFQLSTLLQAGTAAIATGCFLLLSRERP